MKKKNLFLLKPAWGWRKILIIMVGLAGASYRWDSYWLIVFFGLGILVSGMIFGIGREERLNKDGLDWSKKTYYRFWSGKKKEECLLEIPSWEKRYKKKGCFYRIVFLREAYWEEYLKFREKLKKESNLFFANDFFSAEESGKKLRQKEMSIRSGSLVSLLILSEKGLVIGEIDVRKNLSLKAKTAVVGLAVERKWRRCGWGSILLIEAIVWAKKIMKVKYLQAFVFSANKQSLSFFKKTGFRIMNKDLKTDCGGKKNMSELVLLKEI